MDITKGRKIITARQNNDNPIIKTDTKGYKCSTPEFYILKELYLSRGQAVSRDKLLDAGWHGRIVSPNSIPVAIANLRRIFREISGNNIIFTKKGFGYGLDTLQGNIQLEFINDNINPVYTEAVTPTPQKTNFSLRRILYITSISLALFFVPFAITKALTHTPPRIKIYTNGINKIITISRIKNTIDKQAINSVIEELNYQLIGTVDFYEIGRTIKDNRDTIILSHRSGLFSIDCINKSHNSINTYVSYADASILNKLKDGTVCQS
ncbi:winged helix-turn-helix domain-containing protein [Shewanella algae]|uniref:winged helix-turn-helix domain-containing protein n=1 Tax=Shewanella algae TaxID=38313 RepID=UPI001AAF13A4|nr:winged helix-turn-helix domain-containing protein [Shewanella algae]MBO2584242.1 winged helix-turn-helix domain-containing protein [Shewanella algae]